jgi:hypothetical protein
MRHHQRCRGADHHGHQVQSRPLGVPQARGAGNADRADGHQRMDHDVDHADEAADQKLKRHCLLMLD